MLSGHVLDGAGERGENRRWEASAELGAKTSAVSAAFAPNAVGQRLAYSSLRRHQRPFSLRPRGARSSHWYMPQRPSSPRAYVE